MQEVKFVYLIEPDDNSIISWMAPPHTFKTAMCRSKTGGIFYVSTYGYKVR